MRGVVMMMVMTVVVMAMMPRGKSRAGTHHQEQCRGEQSLHGNECSTKQRARR